MNVNALKHPSGFLKLVEMGLLVLIMALFFSQNMYTTWSYFVASTFVPCFINAIVLVAIMLMGYDQIQKTPLEVLLYIYYIISFFVSAVLLFTTGNGPCIAAGLFCLMICGIYGADWYFAFVNFNGRLPQFLQRTPATAQTNPAYSEQSNPAYSQSNQQIGLGTGGVGGVGFTANPALQSYPDTVDLGTPSQPNMFNVNPIYPTTMNYPPDDLPTNAGIPPVVSTEPKA